MDKTYNIIKHLRIENGLSQDELAKKVGYKDRTSIAKIEAGQVDLSVSKIKVFAKIFGVSPVYLMGLTHEKNADDNITKEFIPVSSRGVSIPVLGRVVAGRPIGAIEDVLGEIMIEPHLAKSGEFFALKVKGDSMTPDINDDDIVVVKKQEDIESGDIAVVLINAEDATVKKIKKLDNGIMLIGSNPSVFEPLYFSEQEIQDKPVTIVGKVVRAIRQF